MNKQQVIGEILKQYLEEFPGWPRIIVGQTLDEEDVEEMNRLRLRGASWLKQKVEETYDIGFDAGIQHIPIID